MVRISHERLRHDPPFTAEFQKFLEWAFGPTGIPSLRVVAFGDFAYRRTSQYIHNLIVCWKGPNRNGYRVYDPRDAKHREWESLVRSDCDFLSACPFETYWPGPTDIY